MGANDVVLGRLLGAAAQFSDEQIAQTVEMLVAHGFAQGANVLHIEPHENSVAVRYRVDGILRSAHKLPLAALGPMVLHLKTLASLAADERRVPQQGNFQIIVEGTPVQILLSTMPAVGGEHAVLHLSAASSRPAPLEALGFWGESLRVTQKALARPHGFVLVGGEKRSATAATLLSLVASLARPSVSIVTVEDEITQRVPGVVQTELANSGGTADALRAALHHDPNVIMLGHVADRESLQLSIQAANNGHLVLAGVHASSAGKALLHVAAGGVEPFLLGASVQLVIAQQQVPRLCRQCRERHELTEVEQRALATTFGITARDQIRVHALERAALEAGLGLGDPLGSSTTNVTHLWRAKASGCEACHHRGWDGQLNLVEAVPMTDVVRTALVKNPTEAKLQGAAVKADVVPIGLDGLIKVLRGLTTLEAVAPLL
ncbi:MAG TPA: ATPase, T2SS/T4P/T4SS family [Candidatus Saccharimonadales bacterium]